MKFVGEPNIVMHITYGTLQCCSFGNVFRNKVLHQLHSPKPQRIFMQTAYNIQRSNRSQAYNIVTSIVILIPTLMFYEPGRRQTPKTNWMTLQVPWMKFLCTGSDTKKSFYWEILSYNVVISAPADVWYDLCYWDVPGHQLRWGTQ